MVLTFDDYVNTDNIIKSNNQIDIEELCEKDIKLSYLKYYNKEKFIVNATDYNAIKSLTDDVKQNCEDKFNRVKRTVKQVATGRSAKRFAIIAGDAGIGKTWEITSTLDDLGFIKKYEPSSDKNTYVYNRGDIGNSLSDIVAFFYSHKNDNLIVLDDCDAFIKKRGNQAITNILKALLDSDSEMIGDKIANRVTVGYEVASRVNKKLGLHEAVKFEIITDKRLKETKLFVNDKFIENIEDDFEWDPTESERNSSKEPLKNNFLFFAPIIFISNLVKDEIEEAIVSRVNFIQLTLSPLEFIYKLESIIDNIQIAKGSSFNFFEKRFAKRQVLGMLKTAIYSATRNKPIYKNTDPVRITIPLQFRILNDLCGEFLGYYDEFCAEGRDATKEVLDMADKTSDPNKKAALIELANSDNEDKKLTLCIQGPFVKNCLIPYLSGIAI